MSLTDTIPFLSSYPLWARIVVLGCLVIIAGVLVFTPRQVTSEISKTSQAISVGNQQADIINNVVQQPAPTYAVLTPPQEQLLALVASYQRQYATNKLIISRKDGRLYFDGDPKKGEDVSLIRDLFGTVDTLKQREFVELIESLPPEYLRSFPEMRWDSPFGVAITELGSRYLRDRKPQPPH